MNNYEALNFPFPVFTSCSLFRFPEVCSFCEYSLNRGHGTIAVMGQQWRDLEYWNVCLSTCVLSQQLCEQLLNCCT